jgi:hypothetical protein
MFVFIDRAGGGRFRRRGGGFNRDHYIGRVIRIHGNPYTFQRQLGVGGFGNFKRIFFSIDLFLFYNNKIFRCCLCSSSIQWC